MDSFNMCNIKFEKANAIKKHRQIRKIATLFRVIEICVVLALISKVSIQLPVAVKSSSGYFKNLTVLLASPRFIFVLGNVIVITLFVKSGQFSGPDVKVKSPKMDLYDEFIEKSEKNQGIVVQRYDEAEENRGKQSIVPVEKNVLVAQDTCGISSTTKNFQRSQSVNFKKSNSSNKACKELKRSSTENCKKNTVGSHESLLIKNKFPEDKMSSEEFRSAIESFIARQKRFLIDEENSYILE